MRTATLALAALALTGCSATPHETTPPLGTPGGGVASVRAELAGTGNPWVTMPDHEVDTRGREACDGLAQFGTRFYLNLADTLETTSPRPDEAVPDLNRAQTLAAVKASVTAFCPDRRDMVTW